MSTVTIVSMFDNVLPELPGCSNEMAINAIRQSAIDLCRRSKVWSPEPELDDVEAGEPNPILSPPAGSVVMDVREVSIEGRPIDPKSRDELDYEYPNWRTDTGLPRAYTMDGETLRLVPTPDTTIVGGLEVRLSLLPADNATTLPRWMVTRYGDGICSGAKQRLMRMPKKPWSDESMAGFYENEFHATAARASVDAARSMTRAPIRTRSHYK